MGLQRHLKVDILAKFHLERKLSFFKFAEKFCGCYAYEVIIVLFPKKSINFPMGLKTRFVEVKHEKFLRNLGPKKKVPEIC